MDRKENHYIAGDIRPADSQRGPRAPTGGSAPGPQLGAETPIIGWGSPWVFVPQLFFTLRGPCTAVTDSAGLQ